MADLGTIKVVTHNMPASGKVFVVPGAWTLHRSVITTTEEGAVKTRDARLRGVLESGSFSGSVQEGGVPVPNCVVRCYERATGLLISQVRTDAAGLFSIPGVERGSNAHYVIALDPDGGATYNALIFDRVAPV